MSSMFTVIAAGLVRTVLAAAGGSAFFSDDEMTQLIGAVTVVLAAAWSAYQKVSARES